MNKYTETIQESLESESGIYLAFILLEKKTLCEFTWSYRTKMAALIKDHDHKLSYIYLLSIVDQETADELIELLKEPV